MNPETAQLWSTCTAAKRSFNAVLTLESTLNGNGDRVQVLNNLIDELRLARQAIKIAISRARYVGEVVFKYCKQRCVR